LEGNTLMKKSQRFYIPKERREELGFQRIMHESEMRKIMEKIGINVTSARLVGNFATENGYESFKKAFKKKVELFYKPKGSPIPSLKSLGIRTQI